MKLTLHNIKIIKDASIEFSGLTVIAGKNDTGKTTIGKYLYKTITFKMGEKQNDIITGFINYHSKVAHSEVTSRNTTIEESKKRENYFILEGEEVEQVSFIDTPNTLDTFSYIKNASLLFMQRRVFFDIDEHKTDLIVLLSQDITKKQHIPEKWFVRSKELYQEITHLIGGEVYYDKAKDNIFYKKYLGEINNTALKIEQREFIDTALGIIDGDDDNTVVLKMSETANGIKMFGYLQMLLLNNSIKKDSVLILDEPEVHLHPTWQLKYSELVVELVKNGVKVLVNSHSPYMVEALQRYAEKENIKSNFYLAKEGFIVQEDNSNSLTLSKIFEELSEPFKQFDDMDSEALQNG